MSEATRRREDRPDEGATAEKATARTAERAPPRPGREPVRPVIGTGAAFASAGLAFVTAGHLAVSVQAWSQLYVGIGVLLPGVMQLPAVFPRGVPLAFVVAGVAILVLGGLEARKGWHRWLGLALVALTTVASLTLLIGTLTAFQDLERRM